MPIPNSPVKLGILVSHPIQYFCPIFRSLAMDPTIELTVLFRTRIGVDVYHDEGFGQEVQWDIPLLEGYSYVFLSHKSELTGFELRVAKELHERRFDVLLVHGYNNLTNCLAILTAKAMGTRILLRGDTRLGMRHHLSPWKRAFKRWLFRWIDGFVCIGSLNRAYYAAHGVPESKLLFAPFSVNNLTFALTEPLRQQARARLRGAWGLDPCAVCILSASKLIPLKRIDDLIRAFALIQEEFSTAWLIIAGSGEDAESLRQLAETLQVQRIRFRGFQNQSELPFLYAACDLFVMPSSGDAWGLAINEAMAAGLPVIVSNEVGAAPDLVAGKGTGIIYPCGDIDALAGALAALLSSPSRLIEMGQTAQGFIAKWDNNACAARLASIAAAARDCEITKI